MLTPIRRHRRTKQHPIYYQTECLDCDRIISVRWEQEYLGTLPTNTRPKHSKLCPLCNGTQIKTTQISEKEYLQINQNWDIMESTEKKNDDMADWLSSIQCET